MRLRQPERIGRRSETCGNASVDARNDLGQIKRLMLLAMFNLSVAIL